MKKININISTKVILFVTLLTSITVGAEIIISNIKNRQAIEQDYFNQLKVSVKLLYNELEDKLHEFQGIHNSKKIRDFVINRGVEIITPTLSEEDIQYALANGLELTAPTPIQIPIDITPTIQTIKEITSCEDIFILDRNEEMMDKKNDVVKQKFLKYERHNLVQRKKSFFVGHVHKDHQNYYSYISIPFYKDSTEFFGIVVCKVSITDLLKDHQHSIHLGEDHGEASFFDISGKTLVQLNDTDDSTFHKLHITPSLNQLAKSSNNDINLGEIEIDGQKYLAAWKPIPELDLGLLIKINKAHALAKIEDLNNWSIYIGLVFILICSLLALFFSRLLTRPLSQLKKSMTMISQGALPQKIKLSSLDEIGEITKTVNKLVQSLKQKAGFAQKIGRGELDIAYKPESDKDILGHALLEMKDSLEDRAEKDSLRTWIVSGIAEISEILRNNDNLQSLSEEVLAYITQKTSAAQGAFYTKIEDEGIELRASFAYGKKKYLKKTLQKGEGFVGQCILEMDTILRTEIPENYTTISSGILGDKKPTSVLFVPFITNEKAYGVIELASIHRFSEGQIQFVEEVSEIIARTIFNISINETTRKLLEESQRMSSELQDQQQVLQQNAVEMEASQEEIKKANKALEQQITKVNNAQNRLQELLQNASEIITIYDIDFNIKYISPSVEPILGYTQEELINTSDSELIDEEGRHALKNMFLTLQLDPEEKITLQYTYLKKNGQRIWLEATGVNKLDNEAINGILINSRDITERRRAEEEERKRGQMQALSENSPDLITRISRENKIFYINPSIKQYADLAPRDVLNKALEDCDITPELSNAWKSLLKEVKETQVKCSCEIEFNAFDKAYIMMINAIPEFNPQNELESTLIVSHDITNQKAIENEIRTINKQIHDSINYAENIQFAIIPDYTELKQHLPESFIYYKPRDVVSGDFPWSYKDGDDLYLAAVDCTGHGVPGAMISFIGHFLLNDVVRSQRLKNTGEILDRLDQMVTETLKQNEESSKIKDGMDISLCKINLKTHEIEYSGANRPLYFVRDSQLEEVKGNKFPIGGGASYTNKTSFDTHKIACQKGDALYFFSDGYPDQFGGPENKKMGTKRIKELVTDHSNNSFTELYKIIDENLVSWMGNTHQTDDILFIGLKF